MIQQSLIISFLTALWAKFLHFFEHSGTGRLLGGLYRGLVKIWRSSGLFHLLHGESRLERGFEGSAADRFLARFSGFKPKAENSGIIGAVAGFCNSLPHMSLRVFGVFFILAGGIPSGANFIINGYLIPAFVAVAGLGVPLILLNRSLAQLHSGSWVLQKIFSFFYVTPEMLEPKEVSSKKYLLLFGVFGVVLGLVGAFTGLLPFVMAAGGIIGGLLILHRVEAGIFAAAFFAPILPTMLILGLVALTIVSFAGKWLISGKATLKFTYTDIFVLLFAGLVAFSVAISFNPANSAPSAGIYILFITFYFVVKNTMNTKGKLLALAGVLATSGLVVAGFGIWQRVTGNFVMTAAWIDGDMFGEATARIYSFLENPNVLGGYLIFVSILAFAMIYYYRHWLHKLFALGIFGATSLCMVFTHSRGAWLGLLVAFAVFALMRDRRLVVLGILGLIAAPFLVPPDVLQRFLSIGDLADTSTSYRVSIWLGAVDMLRVFWPIGIGQGVENFNFIYNLYAFNAVFTQHSHNLYLQIMIYFGIGGFGLFLLMIGGFFKGMFRSSNRGSPEIKALAAALAAGMAGFLIKGFTDNVWYNFRVLAVFWVFMALAAGIANLKGEFTNEKV
ncbi:MAG: O-antigen ligase family protein [Defluviitaleaceae bacterium]|nr:O-antigen ligase family protein [Defluviitaleaceae bacterium]